VLEGLATRSACHARSRVSTVSVEHSEETALIAAARDSLPVEGLTHRHYRYPARFSPRLARAAVACFTTPGDLVVDPFVGGGTTLVEAMAAGRRSWGSDISNLAAFVSRAKVVTLSEEQHRSLDLAVADMRQRVSMSRPEPEFADWTDAGYLRNMGGAERWRLRKAISQAVETTDSLNDPEIETLVRCVVLRTAQWALEGRRHPPSIPEFKAALAASATIIGEGARALTATGAAAHAPAIFARSALGVETDPRVAEAGPPRLIMTSPPYPGVHVLYHRWQVDGRRETPVPFFIADALDGSGDAYYTLGGRKQRGLPRYFEELRRCLSSMASLSDELTTLVQVVAFADPEWQLPRYLEAVEEAGWEERTLSSLAGEEDGRLWRSVPNRRWYADQRGATHSAREVVLFHGRR